MCHKIHELLRCEFVSKEVDAARHGPSDAISLSGRGLCCSGLPACV